MELDVPPELAARFDIQEELGRVDAARRTFLGVRARGALASPAERATAEAALARLGPG